MELGKLTGMDQERIFNEMSMVEAESKRESSEVSS